jgi:hypothetical protein
MEEVAWLLKESAGDIITVNGAYKGIDEPDTCITSK